MRICFFGDSHVNGTGDDEALGWAGRIVATARRGGIDATYYNLGVRRDTSGDVARRWREEADRRFTKDCPKRLAFSFGANDCAPGEDGRPRVPHDVAMENARSILSEAVSVAPTIMIGPAPVGDPATDERIQKLSHDLGALCAQRSVPCLEIFSFVVECEPWRREAANGDDVHPNREGYSALAAYIETWPELRRWVGLRP